MRFTKIKSLILFLSLLFFSIVSVRADNSLVKFPEWILKEKIRAGYLYAKNDTKYVSLMRENGFNTVIVKGPIQTKTKFKSTLKNYQRWARSCKKEKLHLFIAYNWQPNFEIVGYPYKHVVCSGGITGIAPCPRDSEYWMN